MKLFATAFIIALVAGSTAIEVKNKDPAIADVESRAELFQQRLLMGGEQVKHINKQSFADQLIESSRRRTAAVVCALDPGVVDFFDITVSITPQNLQTQTCLLADQLLLGHDINAILLNYGVGDAGAYDDAAYIAGVCPAPTASARRRLLRAIGFIWKGVGGCAPGMCSPDNGDKRMLTTSSGGGKANGGHRGLVSSWFTNTFKPQMEATLEAAFATELVPLHRGCLGTNPIIDVTLTGSSLWQISRLQCPVSGALGFLSSTKFGQLFVSLSQSKCPTCVTIDFQTRGDGKTLPRGAYVKNEWFNKYGLTVTASAAVGGFTPNGMARIFDTANPGTNTSGDPDLGSPNSKCPGGGPGIGNNGVPGDLGENCVPVGNVLIVQESNKTIPDDNANGGTLSFSFAKPVLFSDIGLIDIPDTNLHRLNFTYQDGRVDTFTYKGLGDNAVQRVIANKRNVRKVDVFVPYSGAVVELHFCPNC